MKILVVDDNQLNLAVVNKYLKEINRISEIILCDKPEKAMNIIEETNVDILILDIIMPIISGFEILKSLRNNNKYDDMPIIMFTSLNDDESYKKCFDLGASDYINKPINVIEFNARIKVAIDSKTATNNLKNLVSITKEQNRELKIINAKLADTKYHLIQSDKMAAIGLLAAGIAHEINNPMGFISSNLEILTKYFHRLSEYIILVNNTTEPGNNTALTQTYNDLKIAYILSELESIIKESESGVCRVTEIVQSLRSFARTAKDDEKEICSLQDIVKQALLISKNEIKYVADLDVSISKEITLYCNKLQISQVLINILVNAAQAIRSENKKNLGLIKISAQNDEHYVFIYIEDNGPGIPDDIQTKIFEPFFTTKDVGKGTGLGLSVSYDIIVNKHTGTIDFESVSNKGTKFTLKLPIEKNPD